jgi:signal transduction histidine kinase
LALRLRTTPLRVRLVGGFAAAMIVVLTGAGGFVFWRVQFALDKSLDNELAAQANDLRQALRGRPATAALSALPTSHAIDQVGDDDGEVVASTLPARDPLLHRHELIRARAGVISVDLGHMLFSDQPRLRVLAFPTAGGVAVTAVRLNQRDEALRELLAQLAIANLAALAVASLVGYRLARAALLPVERYRARAEDIAAGAKGVRLDVPEGVDDEVSRLGHTLNRMLTVQEAAAATQRQFLADASHELRTPLTVITSEVELALRRPRTIAELESALRNVSDDVARLVRLADQLLDLERAQFALPARDETRRELSTAVDRVATRARSQLDGTARHLAAGTSGDALVRLTESQLDQILGNLVDNAIRHGAGDVAVDVFTPRAGLVQVTVTDDGEGMPPEFVPDAIARFRRADTARTTPGSGLGLALVHTIVSGAGGELRACAHGRHHIYPPKRFGDTSCRHSDRGFSATALLPSDV